MCPDHKERTGNRIISNTVESAHRGVSALKQFPANNYAEIIAFYRPQRDFQLSNENLLCEYSCEQVDKAPAFTGDE